MNPERLRYWWWTRQGLDRGRLSGASPAHVLAETGWVRSVGGAAPYLTLRARAGTSREAVDASVASLEIHELPSARGCTYVVPASDFALALQAAASSGDNEMSIALKLGATEAEVERLCDAVMRILTTPGVGPMDPETIRQQAGDAVRHFGPEGQKKGLTTTMPVALGRLQTRGLIRRVPVNGRLDQQRYRYAAWDLAIDPARQQDVPTELARRYFRWAGPATLAEFQWFSGLGVKAAKAAIAPLNLVPLDDMLMFPEDLEALHALIVPDEPDYALVGMLDGIGLLRRNLKSLLDEADLTREVVAEKGTKPIGGLAELPSNAIFDRGRLIGLWEYDPGAESIAWMTLGSRPSAGLTAAVRRTEDYVRAELEDVRTFSLDSPKSRAPRIQLLRQLARE